MTKIAPTGLTTAPAVIRGDGGAPSQRRSCECRDDQYRSQEDQRAGVDDGQIEVEERPDETETGRDPRRADASQESDTDPYGGTRRPGLPILGRDCGRSVIAALLVPATATAGRPAWIMWIGTSRGAYLKSASIGAVGTIPSSRRASSASSVMNASAWSWVNATYSASYVDAQPS